MEQLMLVDGSPTLMDVALDTLIVDMAIQQREAMDPDKIAEYADLYREGRDLGRIVLFDDGAVVRLADGFHRCEAAQQAGLTTLPAEVRPGGQREATLFAASCNLHGKPLSNADKRKRVLTLLADAEWSLWSDGAIARHCGVTQPFVSKLRTSLITAMSENGNNVSPPVTRQYINKHGQQATMQVAAIGSRNGTATCGDCGRPLTDPDSLKRGIGPVCACKGSTAAGSAGLPQGSLSHASREFSLTDSMDIHAPKGTAPWARAMRAELAAIWNDLRFQAPRFYHYLRLFGEHGGYEHLQDASGVPFASLRALCLAAPPAGLGYDPAILQTIEAVLAATDQPPAALGEPPIVSDTATSDRPTSYGALPAKVWAALQARKRGAPAAALATAIDAPPKQVWAALQRMVKQGKATKHGTTYRIRKEER